MAITVQDKTGNATITTSGTVTSVTSPVYVGPTALQFNSSAEDSVSDGNGKISFTIPSGIGTGEFTIQAFISVNSDDGSHGGNHHSDHFIDIGGIQVRFQTSTSLGQLHLAPTNMGYGTLKASTNTNVSPNAYFHFRITRDSSGDIKTWEGNPAGGTGGLEHVLATGNTTNMDGVTIEIGDLGSGGGAFRLDAFEIKDSYSQNTGSSYIIPSQDSTAQDVEGDTLVMIDGTVQEVVDATISTSSSSTVACTANNIASGEGALSISATVTPTTSELISAAASLSINATIEDGYVESGYIDETYFVALTANVFESGTSSISASATVSATAGEVTQSDASMSISAQMGTQNYVEASFIEEGYFATTVNAEVIRIGANLSSTVTLSVTGTEDAEASLDASVLVGDFYVEPSFIERLYFEEGITAQSLVGADVSPSISASVSANANAVFEATASLSSNASVSSSAGFIADGQASLSSSVSVSAFAGEITQGETSVSIGATTSILANAELAGETSVNITATTSIDVNATAAGSITPNSVSTLICSAQRLRVNDRYTLLIPKETRVNTITQETRTVQIPKQTRELEFLV